METNEGKTEALLTKSNRTTFVDIHPIPLRIDTADIPFTTCTRNLGFKILNNLTLNKHISTVCRSACVEIKRISSIRQYMTVEATKPLVCAVLLSRLAYRNSLLSGCSLYLIGRVQKVWI